MKKIISILFICFAIHANAATSITSPTISGHWTMAGSPYDVYNDVSIDAAQSLIIDPGVTVIFHGSYRLTVYGALIASGTAGQQITFTVADTTGFTTDDVTAAGGWHGIQFFPYGGTGADASAFRYCNIVYSKFCKADYTATPLLNALYVERKLTVSNCTFHHNSTTSDGNIDLVTFYTTTGQMIVMSDCRAYENYSRSNILMSINFSGGNTSINECKFYNNISQRSIVATVWRDLLLTNNELYDNNLTGIASGHGIVTIDGNARVTGNKIHHNNCQMDGAIFANNGMIDIIGNFICNNQHLNSGGCGIVDGGGALNLTWNSAKSHAATFYNVRNNIIANNLSPFEGGAIKIYNANATIANNQVVNNVSGNGAGILIRDNASSAITIQNNLFYGNAHDTFGMQAPALTAYLLTGTLKYEHNWTERPSLYEMAISGSGYTLTGDTTTNITGGTPGMIAPTLTANVTTNAVSADFSISATSACIDKGDTTGILAEPADYAGITRIHGHKIDIGAYEYPSGIILGTAALPASVVQLQAHPNPARNEVSVTTSSATGSLTMMDLTGKQLLQTNITGKLTILNIHAVSPGIYFILWTDGNVRSAQRIVVE